MLNSYLTQLEAMELRAASFPEYYHKLIEIVEKTHANDRATLVFRVLQLVDEAGSEKGRQTMKHQMKRFINDI